jgi:hypothetical protein
LQSEGKDKVSGGEKNLWRRLEIILGVASFGCTLADFWLWTQYAQTLPSLPDAAAGRIYLLNTHGTYVYLTISEHIRLYALIYSGAAFFLIAVLIDVLKKPFRK